MNDQVTELKPRTKSDIEMDFIPAFSTINAISDVIFEATKDANSDFLECLPPHVMHNLADRITIESNNVKKLFYELWEITDTPELMRKKTQNAGKLLEAQS